jgi:hypothetical protein
VPVAHRYRRQRSDTPGSPEFGRWITRGRISRFRSSSGERRRFRSVPSSVPVAGRTSLDSAGAGRTIRAQPELAGPLPRIRYAVPPLRPRPESCSNRAGFGSLGELEHPYQHPYAVGLGRVGLQMRDDGAQHVGQDLLPTLHVVAGLAVRFLGHITRSHTFCDPARVWLAAARRWVIRAVRDRAQAHSSDPDHGDERGSRPSDASGQAVRRLTLDGNAETRSPRPSQLHKVWRYSLGPIRGFSEGSYPAARRCRPADSASRAQQPSQFGGVSDGVEAH